MSRFISSIVLVIIIVSFSLSGYSQGLDKKLDSQIELLVSKKYTYQIWQPYPMVKSIIEQDTDADGTPNRYDDCPNIKGVPEYNGCPAIDMTKIITVASPKIIFTDEEFEDIVKAFAEINFEVSTLLATSHDALGKFVELLNSNASWLVKMSVYVDEADCKDANMDLSMKRFDEVKNFLIINGIDKNRISGLCFGDTMPVLDLPPSRFEVELDYPVAKPQPKKVVKKRKR